MKADEHRVGASGGLVDDGWGGTFVNPFATRYVASARVAARDPSGEPRDLEALADRLAERGGSGALVGPHGAGKSTLLRQLAGVLARRSIPVHVIRVRRGADTVDVLRGVRSVGRGGVACVDGWEVLGGAGRLAVRVAAWLGGVGIVVTAHRPGWPATFVECRTTVSLLGAIVKTLPGHGTWFGDVIDADDLAACFSAGAGDLRLSLDLLYDLFEHRGRHVETGLGRRGPAPTDRI